MGPSHPAGPMARVPCALGLATGDGGFWPEGRFDLLLSGPPVRPLDCTDPLPDDRRGRLDVVQAAGVSPQERGLVGDGQPALLHRLDGPPGIIAVVVIDIRGPGQDVSVELREAPWPGLITLEATDAVLTEGFAGQALQGRQLALVAIEPVGLVAFVYQEAQPGGGGLKYGSVDLRMPLKETRHQHRRDP